ncbi:pyridoxamine 5'-phosphate oxidase family protein [Streptomyces sp. BE20]|uniref:pyridoxamine 5'-phosphate oxidase family protein n=1 Tax=Streptomyces sp. BE20 TaxID=3002525 RepID=UPI002E78F008|nr:pyridoxamine 5'-phosphate oxidase family protein [Streptomyces sp. BE20]MEE1826194.1 pyridoxamine 5'-phosphate oxidase family protein [Streptomyces sp. BE20]
MNVDPEAPAVVPVEASAGPPAGGSRDLDEARALELLGGTDVGRVVYTVRALPAVLPVRFRLDAGGGVLVSAAAGSELARAVDGAVIAFEADEVDGTDGTGWCVTVLGRAEVRRPARGPGAARVEIRIGAELVVGRHLTADLS